MGFLFKGEPLISEYNIESDKLPQGESAVFTVISDLHECSYGDDNTGLLSAIDKIKPDMVLIPGDLVDASVKGDARETLSFLKRLHELYPDIVYAPGNHERKLFERISYTRQMMLFQRGLKRAGVSLLRNERVSKGCVNVYSLDLNHGYYRRVIKRRIPDGMLDILLGKADDKRFNILLAHDPDHFPEYIKWKPDLIFSGHIHGGLIRLPKIGGLISPAYTLFPKYDGGLYERDSVKMIVSRGAGSHTFNIRINNRAEILKVVINGTGSKA